MKSSSKGSVQVKVKVKSKSKVMEGKMVTVKLRRKRGWKSRRRVEIEDECKDWLVLVLVEYV